MDTESVTTPTTRTPHRARRILGVLALTAALMVDHPHTRRITLR
ncbi:hypothetical protein [Rhodococcus sp. Leaf278]|nr:hypothetical protein [Rhodococcus sp. Leaf278]